jgi:hypothetical protein
MHYQRTFPVSTVAPKAWSAICQLLGGASRINPGASTWKDSFIVNLGTPAGHNKIVKPQSLHSWHCDGDFFVHYLDSPEQALLVIPLWTDVVPGGGGTLMVPSAIPAVVNRLYEHPEGCSPGMTLRREDETFDRSTRLKWYNDLIKTMPDSAFVEATGVVGDVYLLHPWMVHSASNNMLRRARVITNPKVSLVEPFCFDREDGNYSLVERMTLKVLGKERLEGWKITREREVIITKRLEVQMEINRAEEERLRKMGAKVEEAKEKMDVVVAIA